MTDTEIIKRAAKDAEDRRGHRLVWIFVGVALVGMALLALSFFAYRASTADQLRQLDDRADSNAVMAQNLAGQVRGLGGTPVVNPPAAAVDGQDGADGRDGVDGRDGRDGRDGEPGVDGRDGEPGTDGAAGSAGQDGSNPPCLDEPTQCRGADGEDGADGQDGAQGPPGPTCPPGYTAQPRTYDPTPLIAGDEETWWVCVNEGQR